MNKLRFAMGIYKGEFIQETKMLKEQSSRVVIGKDTRHFISLRVESTAGKGFACFLSGGEKPHVGAVAMLSRKDGERSLSFSTANGTIDEEAAMDVARILYKYFGEPVAVTAGIEVPDMTEADLKQLKVNWVAAAKHFCGTYDKR